MRLAIGWASGRPLDIFDADGPGGTACIANRLQVPTDIAVVEGFKGGDRRALDPVHSAWLPVAFDRLVSATSCEVATASRFRILEPTVRHKTWE